MRYDITDHHSTLGSTTTRKRRDAAAQELWRVVREALSDYGLCDTKHAWSLYDQWRKLRFDMQKKLRPGFCWSATFHITDGRSVSFQSFAQ